MSILDRSVKTTPKRADRFVCGGAQPGVMATRRRLRFIHAQVAWMLAVITVLALLGSMELELFFVLSLIGFLIVVELTAPIAVTPAWRRRLPWIIAIGLVVFGAIVIRRILEILPPGVFG
jgi:hypothetical protein